MSAPPPTPHEAPVVVTIPVLSANERRALGVLVEKAKTTPDAYPLSLNALTTGCNQKSNRDPLMDLSDLDVEETLAACQQKKLAFKITGGRVERYKHNLYEAWKINKVEIAVIGELLLRGAQTEGELRGRASRMEPIEDLETLRTVLRSLAERKLVVYLTPEGRRGTTVTHGFHSPKELDRLRQTHPADAPDQEERSASVSTSAQPEPAKPAVMDNQLVALQAEVAALRNQVTALQATVADLGGQLRSLKESLGA